MPDLEGRLRAALIHAGSRGSLSCHRKDSFFWYQKVIATNGEDLD